MVEYAYTANDNDIRAQFQVNNVFQDLSSATKISLEIFSGKDDREIGTIPVAEFNTVTDPSFFDMTDLVNGNIIFKPGPNDLELDADPYYARWVVYGAEFLNGIVWGNNLIKYIVVR